MAECAHSAVWIYISTTWLWLKMTGPNVGQSTPKEKWWLWPQWNPTFEPHLILGLVENRILRNPRVCHRIPHSFRCRFGGFSTLGQADLWLERYQYVNGRKRDFAFHGGRWHDCKEWRPRGCEDLDPPEILGFSICWATFWDKFIVIYPHEVYNSPIFDPLSLGCKECRWLETECKKLCFDRQDFWKLDAGNIYRDP